MIDETVIEENLPKVWIGQFPPTKSDQNADANWGTHTMPKQFWTNGKPGLLKDPSFRERRLAKRARHLKNQDEKREINRNGPVRRGK